MKSCKFVEGPTASNKTGKIIETAVQRLEMGEKTLLVGPSIECLKEYKLRGEAAYPSVLFEVYHSECKGNDSSGSVRIDVERILGNQCRLSGRIVCITHALFQNLSTSTDWSDWDVMIDEALDVFEPTEKNLHYSHSVITEALDVESLGSTYAKLIVTDAVRIRAILNDPNKDALRKDVSGIASRLLNDNFDVFTLSASYDSLINGFGQRNKLYAYAVYSPRVLNQFGNVTVLSARFSESIHYQIWASQGVVWIEDNELSNKLKYRSHVGFDKLTIYHGYEGGFSKTFRDKNPESYASFIHRAVSAIGAKTFIRLENNDVKFTSPLSRVTGGVTIEGRSNGLNRYRHIDHAIIVPALNFTSQASRFLEKRYRIDKKVQFVGLSCHAIYQAASRTSMRDGDLSIERRWVVPTMNHAQWLSSVFEGSSIVSLGLNDQPKAGKPGRPKQYNDSNARKVKNRLNKKNVIRQTGDFECQIADNIMDDVSFIDVEGGVVNTIISKGEIVALHRASVFKHRFDNEPSCLLMKPHEFRSYLRNQSKIGYENKHNVPLMSPAFFNPSAVTETNRGRKNTVFASGIMLDLDNSHLRPNDFGQMFPFLSMILYNTFSNRYDDLRYRVYIETTRPMSVPEYKAIVNEIISVVEDRGYERRTNETAKPRDSVTVLYHGIDMSKRGPYSLFHLPCRANDVAKGSSFFKVMVGPGRAPLDVNEWIHNLPTLSSDEERGQLQYRSIIPPSGTFSLQQEAAINEAMSEWYRYGVMPGNGCEGMLTLYSKLHRLRLPDDIVGDNMYAAALSANSPEDRRRQVDGLIVSRRDYLMRVSAK